MAAFAATYAGARDGARAAEAAGYAGTAKDLKNVASRLLRHPDVIAAVRARGVALPSDGEPAPASPAAATTAAAAMPAGIERRWLLGVASGKIKATRMQLDAMRAAATAKAREGSSPGGDQMELLRTAVATAIEHKLAREQTADGVALALSGLRSRCKTLAIKRVLSDALRALDALRVSG